jgi:hypothetical protein
MRQTERRYPLKRLEKIMATELETIAAAVARSEASSEKTLALVQSMSTKIENMRATTTDPNTAAQLLALAQSLNAESDKVDAGETAGEAAETDPVVTASTPVADPTAPAAPVDPTIPTTDDQSTTTSDAAPVTTSPVEDPDAPATPIVENPES